MSGTNPFKGCTRRKNDRSSKNISVLKRMNSPIPTNVICNLLQYDQKDFPSLTESLEKPSQHAVPKMNSLTYSEKLKVPYQNTKQTPISTKDTNHAQKVYRDNSTTHRNISQFDNCGQKNDEHKNFEKNTRVANQCGSDKLYNQKNSQNHTMNKNVNSKIKMFDKSSVKPIHDQTLQSDLMNSPSKTIECTIMYDQCLAKQNEMANDTLGKTKKKKRKSKIKRTAAFQTGKLNVLTPEIHSKILNQSGSFSVKNASSILTDINDEKEYPELGKTSTPSSQKENVAVNKNLSETVKEETANILPAQESHVSQKEQMSSKKSAFVEKKTKTESKTVHLKDPITVTFFDMLMAKSVKTKPKEIPEEADTYVISALTKKPKTKKGLCQAPNLLDSSCPVVKRGKERENPKPKKPSQLKKIILMDRKLRKEQLLKLHTSNKETENESEECDNSPSKVETVSEEISDLNDTENFQHLPLEHVSYLSTSPEMSPSDVALDFDQSKNIVSDVSENVPHTSRDITIELIHEKEKPLNVLESNDSLLKSLSEVTMSGEVSDREKATKILLHTRNFREYCNHLISKDIDEAVHALLGDLARFQDRLHQKDPLKARIKRRMIYGIKEVKKHIKLKKIKCVVIATDLENVEMEGGLNDVLSGIKSLAAEHNIPCVFAMGRKSLGKVCHKPVPISCIGIFNAEGSEANFKKMVELLIQSTKDYSEILKNLMAQITDEEVTTLLKAKKEPETLNTIRPMILRKYLLLSQSTDPKKENCDAEIDTEDTE